MTRRIAILAAVTTLLLTLPCNVSAQYYNTGQSPASLRWSSISSDSLRVIYPSTADLMARRVLFYMDSLRGRISYGYPLPPLRTPVVMHTENFSSNGLAILAPRHIEMGAIPAISTYSEPWLKQLASHEYRHMVQYGNLNRSTVKVFGWLFGQQAPLLATGLLPFWFIEGDAVMAETQLSSFGRGLQPSFTMHYRALGREILSRKNPDKWFCGSYRDHVPSHYELGFQLVSYADRTYDEYIGAGLTRFTSNYPILIFTTQLALRKYYGTSTRRLFRDTFTELNSLWDSLPAGEGSPHTISPPAKTYTEYSHPIYVNDSTLLALKEDYDRYSRFVEIDLATGVERTVCHTGPVSTRPVCRDGIVAWTEYRQSALWSQKINSRLCIMNYADGRCTQLPEAGDGVLYPVLTDRGMAYVQYTYDGTYSIRYVWRDGSHADFPFRSAISLHGLAWDDDTALLYYIALSDNGMWIGSLDPADGDLCDVTAPAHVTLSDLRADDGMLYFGSIYSGRDEAHTIDLSTGRQYRISDSRYGSFAPAPSPTGKFAVLTTYGRHGYSVALQEVEYREEVEWTPVPRNMVNAPLKPWEVAPVDDMVFTSDELDRSRHEHPSRRYRKATHLFNLHSWAPIYYKPDELMSDYSLETQFGVTLISQNLLNTAETNLGYGYTLDGHSTVRARFGYYGWAPHIDITAQWSDRPHQTLDFGIKDISYSGSTVDLSARIYLPLFLSTGYTIRSLVPQLQYSFNNTTYIYTDGHTEYSSLLLATLQYSEYVRKARLDLQPRWGYTLRVTAAGNPFGHLIAPAWSIYGRVYTPGLFMHHGLTLAAAYQHSKTSDMTISVIDFQPRGYDRIAAAEYFAASADYMLPVAYPDWGLSGVFFLKRISLEMSFQYARYRRYRSAVPTDIYTYGGAASFDIAWFRMPSEATTTLSVGIYKPRHDNVFVTWGFSVPL